MRLTNMLRNATSMLRGAPRSSTTVAPAASPIGSTGAGVQPSSPGARAGAKASFAATRERFKSLLGLSRPPYATPKVPTDRRALVETEWRIPFVRANRFGRSFPAHAVRIAPQKPARPLDPSGDWGDASKAGPAPGTSASAQRRAVKAQRMLAKTIGKFTAKRADQSANADAAHANRPPRDAAELEHWLDHREGLDSWVREYFGAPGLADPVATLSALLAQAAQSTESVHAATGDAIEQAGPSATDSTHRFAPSLMLGYAVLSALGSNEPARAAAALQALPEVVSIEGIALRAAAVGPHPPRPPRKTPAHQPP
ncbi:hypothetical protein, partial [Paraburkholderia nemoris]|uniref:hypothetical protein n=1 Tax=Paraburkholderia nemoris TaxID=2793076 RepID=UPI0038B83147